jgi:transposase
MRGQLESQPPLFTAVSPSSRVPKDHPARRIKQLADEVLRELAPVLDRLYATHGRPSIPPECLLKAQLLIARYSVRSERQFCERLDYDLLFRFVLDLDLDTASWDATRFTKNRDRLMRHDVARLFFEGVLRRAQQLGLLSRDHFTVHGHAAGGVGQSEELPAARRTAWRPAAARRPGQSDGQLPRREKVQRHASVDDRSRGATGEEERGQRSEAQLLGACAEGEPPRAVRRFLRRPGGRLRRA